MDTTPRTQVQTVTVLPVCNHDDMLKALSVRAAVFMGEHNTPYDREFDGNDFHATHILALVDGEPAGTMRLRYFGEFALPERLAVLPKFRERPNLKVAFKVVRFGIKFLGRKGFRKFYGRSLEEVMAFWKIFGARPMENGRYTIDHYQCIAIEGDNKVPDNYLTMHSGHLVLMRTEGHWDAPGPHDRAAAAAVQHTISAVPVRHRHVRNTEGHHVAAVA